MAIILGQSNRGEARARERIEQKAIWSNGESDEAFGTSRILADLCEDGETRRSAGKPRQDDAPVWCARPV